MQSIYSTEIVPPSSLLLQRSAPELRAFAPESRGPTWIARLIFWYNCIYIRSWIGQYVCRIAHMICNGFCPYTKSDGRRCKDDRWKNPLFRHHFFIIDAHNGFTPKTIHEHSK